MDNKELCTHCNNVINDNAFSNADRGELTAKIHYLYGQLSSLHYVNEELLKSDFVDSIINNYKSIFRQLIE